MTAAAQPATPARGLDAALTVGPAGGVVDAVFFPPACARCGFDVYGTDVDLDDEPICSECARTDDDVDPQDGPVVPPPGEPSTLSAAGPAPPAAWVATVLAVQAADGLAPFTVPPECAPWVAGRWRLYPWRPRLDVTALLEWADQLDPGATVQRVSGSVVAVHGFLAAHPVTLTAESRRIPPPPVAVTERVLREVAAAEQRQLDWERTELPRRRAAPAARGGVGPPPPPAPPPRPRPPRPAAATAGEGAS